MMLQFCKLFIYRKNEELRKNAVDALCCLAHALGEDFTIFIPSIHKLLLKHRLRVLFLFLIIANVFFYKYFNFVFDPCLLSLESSTKIFFSPSA